MLLASHLSFALSLSSSPSPSFSILLQTSRRGAFTIIPVLVGALKTEKEVEYGAVFSKYLADDSNLFVISSDFCHWGKQALTV